MDSGMLSMAAGGGVTSTWQTPRSDPSAPANSSGGDAGGPARPNRGARRSTRSAATRTRSGGADTESGDHPSRDDQSGIVSAGEGATKSVAPADDAPSPLATLLAELREAHREREDFHREEKALTLRIKARCRRLVGGDLKEADRLYDAMEGDGQHPLAETALAANVLFLEARTMFAKHRANVEKHMRTMARQTPVWLWAEGVRGFAELGVAQVVSECGFLLLAGANVQKLWRRMGLDVHEGSARRRQVGVANGYSPKRRSIMWNVGDVLIKTNRDGPYRTLYLERKAYELAREPDMQPMKAHRRAQRVMEKRLLRDLWRAWRAATSHMVAPKLRPSPSPTDAA